MRLPLLASVVLLSTLGACHGKSPAGHASTGTVTTPAAQVVAGSGRLAGGTLTLEVEVGGSALGGAAQGGTLVLDDATAARR